MITRMLKLYLVLDPLKNKNKEIGNGSARSAGNIIFLHSVLQILILTDCNGYSFKIRAR